MTAAGPPPGPDGGPGPAEAPPVEVGRLLRGRYRLVRRLARGGMAEVWEGTDEVLTRPIAVKMLHPHLAADEAVRERFRREAVAAARLAHPRIVATYDAGEDEGTAYIVMELVRGQTLRHFLDEHGPLAPPAVATVGIEVAQALHHAHGSGIVHRDVKPANILVLDPEPGAVELLPRVKVADFGIARAATGDHADLTEPGALLGTAKYLAPEQIEGKAVDGRSDVYALGVVLYELLTGRPPFSGETELATAVAHLQQQPLRPRQVRAGIPRALEVVVCRAMAKEPVDRQQSAAELERELRSIDLGTDDAAPAVVRDPTPPSGLAPTFRQTERSWLVPAAVIVALAVALVVAGIGFSRSDVGHQLLGRGDDSPSGRPVVPALVRSFDPQGSDHSENERAVGLAVDGDPATSWSTERYNTRDFGGLKDGVGLWLQLPERTRVRGLRVSSPTTGWSARVYLADRPGSRLADWGRPAADQQDLDGTAEFDLGGGADAQVVLLWITRLGDDRRVEVAEITVEG